VRNFMGKIKPDGRNFWR